ncbi:MAG: site-specific DNA-methyltransferase, partial [Cytophagales bacterium]|nr:site-specific DNA-methyltransferase [Cytophagales bacterium]
MNDTSLKEIIPQENSIVCSNFVCCPGVTSKAKNDVGDIINETEKPIELLRGILYNHCRGSDVVVDLCSGSGSTTIAAASLRKTCWSVDNRADQVEAARQRLRKYELSTVYRHPQDIFFIEKMFEKKAKPKSSTGKRKKSETPAKATPAKKMKKNRSSSTSPERFKKKTKRTRRTSKNAVAGSQPIPRLNIEPSASTVDDIAFPDISTPATVVSSTAVETIRPTPVSTQSTVLADSDSDSVELLLDDEQDINQNSLNPIHLNAINAAENAELTQYGVTNLQESEDDEEEISETMKEFVEDDNQPIDD